MGLKRFLGQRWLVLSGFGICFAVLSSVQEVWRGDIAKSLLALVLGLAIYLTVGRPTQE